MESPVRPNSTRARPGVETSSRQLAELTSEVTRIASENTRLLQRLAESERRFRRLSMGVVRVQEAERGRISREMHDGVGQSLTALKIQLDLLEQSLVDDGSLLAARVTALRELAERSLQDVRELSRLLRPQMLDELGLVPTLRWLFRDLHKRIGIEVDFVHEGIDRLLGPDVETLVYRLVQEAVTNSAKHARAAAVQVSVRATTTQLLLTIQDHGVGFETKSVLASSDGDGGFGVRGMRDRVRLFGGRFMLHSAPGAGTVISVEVPLRASESCT